MGIFIQQVGHSRNFTLSSETTDCDSNELESEISLDYETSLHSSSRIGTTMPVLEDGLSSGRESENDEETIEKHDVSTPPTLISLTEDDFKSSGEPNVNPTLVLMKKQISEIEKEIKMRATNQNQHLANGGSPALDSMLVLPPSILSPMADQLAEFNSNTNFKMNSAPVHDGGISSPVYDSFDPELEALDPMSK